MNDKHTFVVGTIVGFHALAGEVKVRTETNSPDILLDLETVRVEPMQGLAPLGRKPDFMLTIAGARVDKRMLLLTFEGYEDRTSVEHLDGAKLFALESELAPLMEEEFWVKDLVGLDVFTTANVFVGKVVSIIYGGNDILEIRRESDEPGKTILVPFVEQLVPKIDLQKQRVEVIDVPGLLEAQ